MGVLSFQFSGSAALTADHHCNVDADLSPEDLDILSPQTVRIRDATTGHIVARQARPTDDYSYSLPLSAVRDLETEDSHYILRGQLVQHLYHKWSTHELSWTR